MALRRLFSKRFFDASKSTPSSAATFDRAIASSSPAPPPATSFHRVPPESVADKGFLRLFLLRRTVYHSAPTRLPDFLSLPVGDKLREKLRGINNTVAGGAAPSPAQIAGEIRFGSGISVEEARKILRVSMVEKVKSKLKEVPATSIPYGELVRICVEACENREQGEEFAKMMDETGNVIVLGNVVFLRPEQVAKTMESLIYQSIAKPNDPRRKELEEMEKQKSTIDSKAKAQVKTELYFGLGFLTLQTLGFMRLTFWELSWDVMEPICFFVTSMHFALAYIFFIRTSTEPTFQGFFHTRFKVKQERLMKAQSFDIVRYNELVKACYSNPSHDGAGATKSEGSSSPQFPHSDGALFGGMHR